MNPNIIWPSKPLLLEPKAFEQLLSIDGLKLARGISFSNSYTVKNGIAVLPIKGPLTKRASLFDSLLGVTSYEDIAEEFEAALADEKVKGILLDIDSPGGEAAGMFDLADTIYAARGIKPIWAIANEEAFSAAYGIASSAERIFLSRTGGVGSIGVLATHVDQSAYDEKQGIKVTTIFAGKHKNDYSPHVPLSESSESSLQGEVDRIYDLFTELVARNRGMRVSDVRNTEAAHFFGEQALTTKLADSIGTMPQALKALHSSFSTSLSPRKPKMSQENTTLTFDIDTVRKESEQIGRAIYHAELLELMRICQVAKMPEMLGSFIERHVSAAAAREEIMSLLVSKQEAAISSHIMPTETRAAEANILMNAAKQRAQLS